MPLRALVRKAQANYGILIWFVSLCLPRSVLRKKKEWLGQSEFVERTRLDIKVSHDDRGDIQLLPDTYVEREYVLRMHAGGARRELSLPTCFSRRLGGPLERLFELGQETLPGRSRRTASRLEVAQDGLLCLLVMSHREAPLAPQLLLSGSSLESLQRFLAAWWKVEEIRARIYCTVLRTLDTSTPISAARSSRAW